VAWMGRKSWRVRRRRLTAFLALSSFLAGTIGFPIPFGGGKDASHGKDAAHPFPCQGRSCGCQNAEQCWHHCCCFSREEHLSWARSVGVDPPPDIDPSRNAGWRVARRTEAAIESSEAARGCTRCNQTQTPERITSQASELCESKAPDSRRATNSEGSRSRCSWYVGIAPLKCKGLTTYWVAAGGTFVSLASTLLRPGTEPRVNWIATSSIATSIEISPPDPPPRVG
jgi:hypothetical protein